MSCGDFSWSVFGLPAPDAGVGYTCQVGLVRTRYDDGSYRQRRAWSHWPRRWSLRWTLSAGQLHTLSAWVDNRGHDWHELPLISGEDGAGALSLHTVRWISDLSVSGETGAWQVSAELEQASGLTPADISGWTLPIATVDNYGYVDDYGLIRTPFEAAAPRQQRVYTKRPRAFRARWALTTADLARAEAWIRANGYAWHTQQLLSAESGRETPNSHTVRVSSDVSVTLIGGGYAELEVMLEQACAEETGALEAEVADRVIACASEITTSAPLGLDDEALADAWGDATDWGRPNP
jgi:hypothetical protein